MTALASAACYLLVALLMLRRLHQREAPAVLPWAYALPALLASALHALVLYGDAVTARGIDLGVPNTVSLTTWAVAVMVVLAGLTRRLTALGVLAFPLAALGLAVGALFESAHILSHRAGPGVALHVLTSILAYGVLAIGACQALVLYVQEGRLRQRRPGRFTRHLPPLQMQEQLLVQVLMLGFFLLSLSLITGVVFVADLLAQHLVHKTVLTSVAWLMFAAMLYARWRHGWRGRTLSRWMLCGFALLMLGYLGSKLVLEIVLGRRWSGP